MKQIKGVVPVIPIPFNDDESIDEPSLRRAVDFVASRKLGAMCLPAYGSEFYKLSEEERLSVVTIAIDANHGRIPVIAQANHPSAKLASELARRYESLGADVISFAIPRQFATTHDDVRQYCGQIASSVKIPVLIQDFNPGGATIGAEFLDAVNAEHPNIQYAKLEEPLIVDKLIAIRQKIGDRVQILEGWGGYYMLEAIPAGICGIMPGVPIADLLDRVFALRSTGEDAKAYRLFGSLLPFINFSLQNFELFLQLEKRLMVRRGLFKTHNCRALTLTPSPAVVQYMEFLIEMIMGIMAEEK